MDMLSSEDVYTTNNSLSLGGTGTVTCNSTYSDGSTGFSVTTIPSTSTTYSLASALKNS